MVLCALAYKIGKFLPVVRYDMYRDKAAKTSANNKDNFLFRVVLMK